MKNGNSGFHRKKPFFYHPSAKTIFQNVFKTKESGEKKRKKYSSSVSEILNFFMLVFFFFFFFLCIEENMLSAYDTKIGGKVSCTKWLGLLEVGFLKVLF